MWINFLVNRTLRSKLQVLQMDSKYNLSCAGLGQSTKPYLCSKTHYILTTLMIFSDIQHIFEWGNSVFIPMKIVIRIKKTQLWLKLLRGTEFKIFLLIRSGRFDKRILEQYTPFHLTLIWVLNRSWQIRGRRHGEVSQPKTAFLFFFFFNLNLFILIGG